MSRVKPGSTRPTGLLAASAARVWSARSVRPALAVVLGLAVVLAAGCGSATPEPGSEPPPSPQAGPHPSSAKPKPPPVPIDWSAVGRALGTELTAEDGGVWAGEFPRTDLTVTNDNIRLAPGMELGTEAMFTPTGVGSEALVLGEFTVTEAELNPVVSRLQRGGIEISAIHQHLPDENPRLWWLHYTGYGDPVRNAATLHDALLLTGTPVPPAEEETEASAPPLDTAAIDRIIGHSGDTEDGAYQIHIPLSQPVRDTTSGITLPARMEAATLLMFEPLDGGRAAINGDFALTAQQIDPVIAALRAHDIDVVSLHNHLTHEQPRLFYLHFWANSDLTALARGLRAALDATAPPR